MLGLAAILTLLPALAFADNTGTASVPVAQDIPRPMDCTIKGKISSKGERIYHVPGGQYYDRTRIDAAKGERWFCSEEEAQAAGWRGARQ